MILVSASTLLAVLLQSAPTPGLLVTVFHRGEDQSLGVPASLGDLGSLVRDAAVTAPDAMYVDAASNDTALVLSGSDDTATSDFLGAHANPLTYDSAPLWSTLVDFRGSLSLDTPGTYTLSLRSADDLAAVYVGGNGTPGSGRLLLARNVDGSLANAPGLPNPITITISGSPPAPFPIEVVYYNQDGGGLAALNFSISGPGQGTYNALHVDLPDPTHLYKFLSTDCQGTAFDTAPGPPSNGILKGGATVADSRMNTYGTAWDQGACLTSMASTAGSFSLQQRVTVADGTPPVQTLFCFATDANNYLVARTYNNTGDGSNYVHVDLANRYGAVANLVATDPLPIQASVLLHLVYDASAQGIALYQNGRLQSSAVTQADFSLQGVSANLYTGINGFSVFGDPSLNGSCTQFAFFNSALTHDQVGYESAAQ